MKFIVLMILFCSIMFSSCNTICFYENVNGKDVFSNEFSIFELNNEVDIEFSYLEQINLIPISNFSTSIHYGIANPTNQNYISDIEYSLDIYDVKNILILPLEEHKTKYGISKRYNYSIFFPKNIKINGSISFIYKNKKYSYTKESIIVKKRNRTWWSVASEI